MLSFVLTKRNTGEVYQATLYWKRRGVKTRVMSLNSRVGSLSQYGKLKPKIYYGWPFFSSFRHQLQRRIPAIIGCHRPFSDMCILYNGDVILCCRDWNRTMIIGNVKTSSIKEIWNCDEFQRIRLFLWRKKYDDLAICKKCDMVGRPKNAVCNKFKWFAIGQ